MSQSPFGDALSVLIPIGAPIEERLESFDLPAARVGRQARFSGGTVRIDLGIRVHGEQQLPVLLQMLADEVIAPPRPTTFKPVMARAE